MEPNILWIHGWGMSSRVWGDVSTLLPGVRHHFFTYAGCDTMDSFQTALHNKILSVDDGTSWTLIGWSLGGMLAIEQWMNWVKNPVVYSIHSVIIVSSSLRFANTNRHLGWPERVIERMRKQLQQDPQETLLKFACLMFSESDRQSAAFVTMTDNLSAYAQGTDFTLAGLDAGLEYLQNTNLIVRWNELHEQLASPPLLWLHGAEDSICPTAGMPLLNSAEVFIFPETGHIPFLTKPDIFYEKVRSFVYANRSHSAQ